MTGGAAMNHIQEQEKGVEGAQENVKPVAVEQIDRLKALEQKVREKSLQNGTLFTPEQRKEAIERLTMVHGTGLHLTSKGTEVILEDHSRSVSRVGKFSLAYASADNRTVYYFSYEADGKFQKLDVYSQVQKELQQPLGQGPAPKLIETHTNLWAEKRGDSFIKDIQRTKTKDTESKY